MGGPDWSVNHGDTVNTPAAAWHVRLASVAILALAPTATTLAGVVVLSSHVP
jgi:hypothetical protein